MARVTITATATPDVNLEKHSRTFEILGQAPFVLVFLLLAG